MSTSATFPLPASSSASTGPTRPSSSLPFSDVRLFHTADGGEIEVTDGLIVLSDGLETAVYLSLFGGNEQDSGQTRDNRKQWWGNFSEPIAARNYRSETQHLLMALPATTANLRALEEAAKRDVAWMAEALVARAEANASIPRHQTVELTISLVMKDAAAHNFSFQSPWGLRA